MHADASHGETVGREEKSQIQTKISTKITGRETDRDTDTNGLTDKETDRQTAKCRHRIDSSRIQNATKCNRHGKPKLVNATKSR